MLRWPELGSPNSYHSRRNRDAVTARARGAVTRHASTHVPALSGALPRLLRQSPADLGRVDTGIRGKLGPPTHGCAILRPVPPDGRDLTARAEVVHRGRSIAIAGAEVTNAEGKRVLLATGSVMYLPGRPASLGEVELASDDDQ